MATDLTRENALRHHDTHPLIMDLLLTTEHGPEWWGWEPETQRQILAEGYPAGMSELSWNKLQAVSTFHVAPDLVLNEWECFLPTITALNNVIPDFNVLQLPSPPRLYAGVRMLRMFDKDIEFGDEVARFVASSMLHEGVYFAPGELSFVQHLLRRPYYICPDCGNQEEVLYDHDGVCDACGRDWHSSLAGKPVKEARVKMHNTHDEAPVRARFQEAAKDWEKYIPSDDDEFDVQVCKLAAAIDYSLQKDRQFLEQKEALRL